MSKQGKSRKFTSVGQALPAVIRRLKLVRVVEGQRLVDAWPGVAGEKIAQHTRALSFEKGVLTVAVDGPVWMTELRFLKPQLMRSLAPKIARGRLKDIRFVLSRSKRV